MTEHRRYADLAAMAIDFTLDPIDAEDLRRHLETCTACRRVSDAMRADAAALRSIDFGPAPVIVRDHVAAVALKGGVTGSPRLLLLFATGLLLLLAIFAGSAAVGAFLSQQKSGPDLSEIPIHWQTEVVELAATDLWIEANGQRFSPVGLPVSVVSDPRIAESLTLTATWQQGGREMRLNLYFDADKSSWWVHAIEAYDGTVKPNWAATKGEYFKTPLNRPWAGNVNLPLDAGGQGVTLHVSNMQLIARPRANLARPDGGLQGGPVKPINPRNGNVFARGGELHCSGIFQMSPADAHQALLRLGYNVSWRWVKDGISNIQTTPPRGVIYDAAIGMSGELVVFAAPKDAIAPIPQIDFSDCTAPTATTKPAS